MSLATRHRPRCPSSPRRQNQVPLKEFDLGARDACDPRKRLFRQPGIYTPPAIPLAGFMAEWYGYESKPWYLMNPKIAGKWMFIPLKMVLIGIDPYPYCKAMPVIILVADLGQEMAGSSGESRPTSRRAKATGPWAKESSKTYIRFIKWKKVGSTLMICKIGFSRLHMVLCLSLGLQYGPTNCELPLACRTPKPSHFSLVLPPFPRIKAASSSVILRVSTCWMATLRYPPGLCLGSRRLMGENGTTEIESNDHILIVALYPFLWFWYLPYLNYPPPPPLLKIISKIIFRGLIVSSVVIRNNPL